MRSATRPCVAFAAILVPSLIFTGCVTPAEDYVKADRATFKIVGEEYLRYVLDDRTIDRAGADARQDLVTSWRRRIEMAEKAWKGKGP